MVSDYLHHTRTEGRKTLKETVAALVLVVLAGTFLATINIQIAKPSDLPSLEWTRTFGGSSDDGYHEVQLTKPRCGGYAITGVTESFGAGSKDFWLIKTDEAGNMEWNQTYGGTGADWVLSIVETSDSGYVLFGHTNSFGAGNWDFWLVKTDRNGDMEWNKTYGGSGRDEGRALVQTPDGGYAMAGFTDSFGSGGLDWWLVKANSIGEMEWNRTYGTGLNEYAYALILLEDGFAIAGQSGPHASSNAWLMKVDSLGNHQWDETYGGTSSDLALSAIRTDDGGFAMTGYTRSFESGDQDFWLVKTDETGNMEWLQTYRGAKDDHARHVIQTEDDGYAILGATSSQGVGGDDIWLVKTNSSGDAEWNQTYGGAMEDWGDSIVQTSSGAFVLAGWTKSYGAGNTDFWLLKTASPMIQATIDIDPNGLNLRSLGQWITVYIELPDGYDVNDIDVSTLALNNTIPVDLYMSLTIGDEDADGVLDLMVKFSRSAITAFILEVLGSPEKFTTVVVTLSGELDDGTIFEGSDTITVIYPMAGGGGRSNYPR